MRLHFWATQVDEGEGSIGVEEDLSAVGLCVYCSVRKHPTLSSLKPQAFIMSHSF